MNATPETRKQTFRCRSPNCHESQETIPWTADTPTNTSVHSPKCPTADTACEKPRNPRTESGTVPQPRRPSQNKITE